MNYKMMKKINRGKLESSGALTLWIGGKELLPPNRGIYLAKSHDIPLLSNLHVWQTKGPIFGSWSYFFCDLSWMVFVLRPGWQASTDVNFHLQWLPTCGRPVVLNLTIDVWLDQYCLWNVSMFLSVALLHTLLLAFLVFYFCCLRQGLTI